MKIKNNSSNFIFPQIAGKCLISNQGGKRLISWLSFNVYLFPSPEPIYNLMFLLSLKTQILYFPRSVDSIPDVMS